MYEQQSDMEFYLRIIDGINKYRGRDIDKIIDELKISRATFFRKLKILKGKGFRRKIVFDYCGIGLKIAYLFLKSDSLINIIQYIKQIPGASYLYESFVPDRLFIMKLYLLDERFLEKLYKYYIYEYLIKDVLLLDLLITPIHYYHKRDLEIPIDVLFNSSCNLLPDHIDYIIIEGFLRGFNKLKAISEIYGIPYTQLFHHYREHVREHIVGITYVFEKEVNNLVELAFDKFDQAVSVLRELYVNHIINYVDLISSVRVTNGLCIVFLELSANYRKLIQTIGDMIDRGRILDARIFPVINRFASIDIPVPNLFS